MAKINSAIKATKKVASKATSATTQKTADTLLEVAAKRQSAIEEAFSKAKKAGSKNNTVYLSKDSSIYKNYLDNTAEQVSNKLPLNPDAALQDAIKDHKFSKAKSQTLEKAKKFNTDLELQAYEELGQVFNHDEITQDMINSRKAELRKNTQYERVHIGETEAEATLRERLNKETEGMTTSRTLGGSSSNSSNTSSSGSARSGLSGNSPEPDAYSRRELKANRYNDKESYMRYSVGNQYDDAIRSWENKDYNNPILTALKEEGVDLNNITKDDLLSKRTEKIKNTSANDMGLGDWMGYTKLPQYATAAGGTAWLVSKMSASKGQQSNSQLYGQSPY